MPDCVTPRKEALQGQMPLIEGLVGRVHEPEPEGALRMKLKPVLAMGETAAGEGVGTLCWFALVTMVPEHVPPSGVGVDELGLLTMPHVLEAAHQPHAAFEIHAAWLAGVFPLLRRPHVS